MKKYVYLLLLFLVSTLACNKVDNCENQKLSTYLPGNYAAKYTNKSNSPTTITYGNINFYSDGTFETDPHDLLFQEELEGVGIPYTYWDAKDQHVILSAYDKSHTRYISIEYVEEYKDCSELILSSHNGESEVELIRN